MTTNLATLLRRARTDAGFTQEALAERLGCSKAQLSLMESGQRTINEEWARRIEVALDIKDGRLVAAVHWTSAAPALRARLHNMEAVTDQLRHALKSRDPVKALEKLLNRSGEGASGKDSKDHSKKTSRVAGGGYPENVDGPLPLARQIPVINQVAAGYPSEFTDLDYPASVADEYIACPDVNDPDAFAARVVGDSMQPEYYEGEIVVFSPALPTPAGCDCFVRLVRDNEVTFKRVYFDDEGETIRLQPLNSAYPPRSVDREDVAGMYAAAYVLRAVRR